jgi:glycosyltransferase involved in cell wall biosynthesis
MDTSRPVKVARIVTSYGHWRLIDRWLSDESLLQPHVSWIFINDKPGDPLPDDMKERINRFGTVIQSKVNLGRCCARNLGVQSSDSTWIDIIDGDDIPLPLSQDFDSEAAEAGFIYFDVTHHTFEGGQVVANADEGWIPPHLNQLLYDLVGNYDPRPIAVMWRRSTFNALGGFDGRTDYVEDFNLVLRAILAGYKYTKTSQRKGSYQRHTPGRMAPPIVAVANLHNWELARFLADEDTISRVEFQIQFWRKQILWAGMREMEKSKPSLPAKLREIAKWLAGVHS